MYALVGGTNFSTISNSVWISWWHLEPLVINLEQLEIYMVGDNQPGFMVFNLVNQQQAPLQPTSLCGCVILSIEPPPPPPLPSPQGRGGKGELSQKVKETVPQVSIIF